MEWINLYFSARLFKTVVHFLYILQCLMLTSKLLAYYGISYSYPDRIDAPVILDFLFRGTWLIPSMTFLLCYAIFNNFNKGLNYLLFRATRGKLPLISKMKDIVIRMAPDQKWFQAVNGKFEPMDNYSQFVALLQSFDDLPRNFINIAVLVNSVVLGYILCLLVYPLGGVLRMYLLVAGILFYITHLFNVLFLRTIKSDIEFYRKIRRQTDRKTFNLMRFAINNGWAKRRPKLYP